MAGLVGAACIVAAWFYTGGTHPYGYHGLGEVMVFVFFGLVAVLGTTYVSTRTIEEAALYAGVGIGALAFGRFPIIRCWPITRRWTRAGRTCSGRRSRAGT